MFDSPREPIDAVLAHLERYLGPVVGDWAHHPDGAELAFQVVHFQRQATATEVYSTLGLSDYGLGPERLRCELIMIAPLTLPEGAIPPILVHAGELPIEADQPPRLGDVFVDVDALADLSPMSRLTVARPLYQPPEFAFADVDDDCVAFLWLIPVYESEAAFVEDEGWEAFEQLMWDVDADPIDFQRAPWL